MTLKNAKLVFKEFSNDSHRNRDRTILHRIVPCNANKLHFIQLLQIEQHYIIIQGLLKT